MAGVTVLGFVSPTCGVLSTGASGVASCVLGLDILSANGSFFGFLGTSIPASLMACSVAALRSAALASFSTLRFFSAAFSDANCSVLRLNCARISSADLPGLALPKRSRISSSVISEAVLVLATGLLALLVVLGSTGTVFAATSLLFLVLGDSTGADLLLNLPASGSLAWAART